MGKGKNLHVEEGTHSLFQWGCRRIVDKCGLWTQQLWKESSNRDGDHFHQYKQNEQSLQILTHWTHTIKEHDMWRCKYVIDTELYAAPLAFCFMLD